MAWQQSQMARMFRTAGKRLAQASEESALVGAARSLVSRVEVLVQNSYGYHWLTAEPDPEVIVIDLRETRTVGPFVRLLETVLKPVERAWSNSGLESVTIAVGSALADSRIGVLLVTLLEPPEPPENEQQKRDERE